MPSRFHLHQREEWSRRGWANGTKCGPPLLLMQRWEASHHRVQCMLGRVLLREGIRRCPSSIGFVLSAPPQVMWVGMSAAGIALCMLTMNWVFKWIFILIFLAIYRFFLFYFQFEWHSSVSHYSYLFDIFDLDIIFMPVFLLNCSKKILSITLDVELHSNFKSDVAN